MAEVEYKSECEFTKDTWYLALMSELWGVFCEDSWENWLFIQQWLIYGRHKPLFKPKMADFAPTHLLRISKELKQWRLDKNVRCFADDYLQCSPLVTS